MKTGKKVGIWIDHRKAVIVNINPDSKETLKTLMSKVEPRVRMSGGWRGKKPGVPWGIASETRRDEKFKQHLNAYYDQVVEEIKDSEKIMIMGPGEAKGEFIKVIEKNKDLGKRIIKVATKDKMTDNQILAEFREFYRNIN